MVFLEQTQEGLRERIAGYQEAQDKQSDSALMKQVKEMERTTEMALKKD